MNISSIFLHSDRQFKFQAQLSEIWIQKMGIKCLWQCQGCWMPESWIEKMRLMNITVNGTMPFSMQPWYRKNLLSAWNLNRMVILYFNCILRLWRAFPCICMLFLYNAFSVSLVCLPAHFQHAFWMSEIQIA